MRAGGWLKPLSLAGVAVVLASGALHGGTRTAPCASTELTASIGNQANQANHVKTPAGGAADRLSIVLVGDTGFNANGAPVDARRVRKNKRLMSFAETVAAIAPDIDGDLAFLNLETVITDRNDLARDRKGQKAPYNFRSHPLGLKALMESGFNLFSLANNHAMDYGAKGLEETLYHMAVANAERAIAFAGIGSNFEEATRPGCLDVDGVRIGLASISIITGQRREHRAGPNKPGLASYRHRPDFEAVVNRLAESPTDYRILSVHYGLEGRVVPDKRQLADWREFAARDKGVDLIVGHHPHVVQGVEVNGKSVIFYGLGNFLHPGTAKMTRFGICRDYGLMAKVHLARGGAGWRIQAIEAIPLTKTHMRPERFAAPEAKTRIYALNHIAAKLDDGGSAHGVRFTTREDGSGLYCAPGAADLGGKLGALCQSWQPASAPPKALARKLASACRDKPFYGAAKKKRRAPASDSPSRDFKPF